MTRKLILCTLCFILMVSMGVSFAGEDDANIATFPVRFNGELIDNMHADYPLLVYRNITYFPMTWDFSTGLGLSSTYSENEGLVIKKSSKQAELVQSTNALNDMSKSYEIDMPYFPITVNGKQIDNATEDYPLFIFRGVTYFPLTWHYAVDEFGWTSEYSEANGLTINSNKAVKQDPVHRDTVKVEEKEEEKEVVEVKEEEDRALSAIEIGALSKSVVKIYVETVTGEYGTGSGFYFDEGKIVTNYHVIEDARYVEIEHDDGSIYEGDIAVWGYNVEKDLAILSVDDDSGEPLKLGDSDSVVQGQHIYTIGSPEGLINTLSNGIVSSVRDGMIQVTAPISHGSSGGALFNEYGEVIGVTSAGIIEGENLGFCIPINELRNVDSIKNYEVAQPSTNVLLPPSYLSTEILSPTEFNFSWENTGADYYVVWISENGGEWYEALNSDGLNKWNWSEGYCINFYDFAPGSSISLTVASVENGESSEYSEVETVTLPYINEQEQGSNLYVDEQELASSLLREYGVLNLNNERVVVSEYMVAPDHYTEELVIGAYIDIYELEDFMYAYDRGIHSILWELASIAAEVERETGYETSFLLIYADYFDDYPELLEYNGIYSNPIEYDYDMNQWFVWYPLVEVYPEYLQDGYSYYLFDE